jgi:hypothetical protein
MDSQDHSAGFSELATRFMTENVQIWQRCAEAVSRFSRREGRGTDFGRQTAGFALNEGGEFIRNLVQLNLDYYSALWEMSVDFTNRVLDQVLQVPSEKSSPQPSAPVVPSGDTRFELVFSGQTGHTSSSSFVVQNKNEKGVEVSFEITEFVSEDSSTRFRIPVEFIPDQFALEPGAEQVVQCRVLLEPEFVPGRRYTALVRVIGFPEMGIGLIVTPQPGTAEESQAAEPVDMEETSSLKQTDAKAEDSTAG